MVMRYLCTVLCLLSFNLSKAQNFTYPKFLAQGNQIAALVPNNWKIIDTAYGDLNNDHIEDLAMVLEFNQAITEKRAYGDAETELINEFQKPRVLAIYFKDAKTKKYQFILQNNNFVLRSAEGGALGEPFKTLEIKKNNLNLVFEGGSNWRWKLDYHFKYHNKDFILVQASNTYYNATSGEMTDKNYDFINRRLTLTKGSVFTRNDANEVSEEILYFSQPRTLTNFKKPWTWEITKDNFL